MDDSCIVNTVLVCQQVAFAYHKLIQVLYVRFLEYVIVTSGAIDRWMSSTYQQEMNSVFLDESLIPAAAVEITSCAGGRYNMPPHPAS